MKKLLLAGFAVGAFIMPAMAADMPLTLPPPHMQRDTGTSAWTWTGLYIGVNVGSIVSSGNTVTNAGTDTGKLGLSSDLAAGKIPRSVGLSHLGFIGGAQIGANWQVLPSWVLGIEADFDGEGGGSNSATAVFPGKKKLGALSTTYNRQLDTLGTARGRFGYLIAPDQLWYVTAGLAYGQTKIGSGFICATCIPPSVTESSTANETSNTSTGWTAGGGIEWKFHPAWSVKAEYMYVDLGNPSNTIRYTYGKNVSTLTSTVNEVDNTVRIGINYKFFGCSALGGVC